MHWIAASLLSALFLGFYELGTKHAVRDNAVLPVLFFATVCSATVWTLLLALAHTAPGTLPAPLHVAPLALHQHLLLLAKSALVATSWVCSYFAIKHLPVSLASPVRATGPMWTLLGAVLVLGERPSWLEGLGIVITLASFVGLSLAGSREGIHFHRDKWPPLVLKFPSIPFLPPIPPLVLPVPTTKLTMRTSSFMELTDGFAKITLDQGAVSIYAPKGITINGATVDVTGRSGDVTIEGGPMVKINC